VKNIPNIRIMNMVWTAGFGFLGVVLFFNKFYNEPLGELAIIALIFSFLVFVPAGTAHALSDQGRPNQQRTMLFANGLLILLACAAVVSPVFMHQRLSLALLWSGVLLFVMPEVINIRALRTALSQPSQGSTA
jgi:small-conductance mechanosensitive channel